MLYQQLSSIIHTHCNIKSDRLITAIKESGLSKLKQTGLYLKEDEAGAERIPMEMSIKFRDGLAEFTLTSPIADKNYYGSGIFTVQGVPDAEFFFDQNR